jgi:hypothetical protein
VKAVSRIIVLVAFLFSTGGQWYVLQGIAWAHMIVEFNHTYSFQQSVSMTFSGQFPCPLCRAIAEHKESETLKLIPLEKMHKLFLASDRIEVSPITIRTLTVFPAMSLETDLESVSYSLITPPPRLIG